MTKNISTLKKSTTLELKAKHFKGTKFLWGKSGCVIEKAAKQQFKLDKLPQERVDSIIINDTTFKHKEYNNFDFDKDKEQASKLRYSDKVIRKVKLIPV